MGSGGRRAQRPPAGTAPLILNPGTGPVHNAVSRNIPQTKDCETDGSWSITSRISGPGPPRKRVGRTVLLGPNGAGKSTMLGVAAGLLHPSAGRVVLNGEAVTGQRDRAKLFRSVALMPQNPSGTKGLTVREHVAYAGWLKGMPRRSSWDAAAEALAMTDL